MYYVGLKQLSKKLSIKLIFNALSDSAFTCLIIFCQFFFKFCQSVTAQRGKKAIDLVSSTWLESAIRMCDTS